MRRGTGTRRWALGMALASTLWLGGTSLVSAQGVDSRLAEQDAENAALRRRLEILERQMFGVLDGAGAEGDETPADPTFSANTPSNPMQEEARRLAERNAGSYGGGIYNKPFLRFGSRTYVGGYIDLEYRDSQDSNRTFRQHRLIPFIYSQITDQLRFAAEFEFEDGGPDTAQGDGEVKVEFATLDYQIDEAFGIRAGAILVPLGRFNVAHDSPVNDLTDRPLVSSLVIPSTFTESGVGVFGTVYPTDMGKLDYEFYVVNGFQGLESDGMGGFTSNFSTTDGLRAGRGSLKTDNNNSLAGVGRVAYSPCLDLEMGASAHVGKYDDRGQNELAIGALDAVWRVREGELFGLPLGLVEFQGEIARAEISRNALAKASGVPDDMWGYYAQCNVHFMPECLRERWPVVFRSESTFTAVTRLGHVELDNNRMQRLTFGFNFRPVEETVFKFDYQINFEDWNSGRIPNDAFLFSVASYF